MEHITAQQILQSPLKPPLVTTSRALPCSSIEDCPAPATIIIFANRYRKRKVPSSTSGLGRRRRTSAVARVAQASSPVLLDARCCARSARLRGAAFWRREGIRTSSRFAGASETGARRRNPERSEGPLLDEKFMEILAERGGFEPPVQVLARTTV